MIQSSNENTQHTLFNFQLENGESGELVITDIFLDNYDIAEQRALSEFLKKGYNERTCSFKTHLTNLYLNETINLDGVKFLIKGIHIKIDAVKMILSVRGIRYEI